MFLLRSGAIEGYSPLVSQLGENPVNLLRDAGMVVAQLRQPNSYLSYEKTADLLDETARQCREPLFGLRLASCQNLLAIGEVALSGSGQATVADALDLPASTCTCTPVVCIWSAASAANAPKSG